MTQREGGAVQVEPHIAVQWPITLDPAGGEDKGLPLGASPPGGLRVSHQLGMVPLVSQFSVEVSIYARVCVHPPSSRGLVRGLPSCLCGISEQVFGLEVAHPFRPGGTSC